MTCRHDVTFPWIFTVVVGVVLLLLPLITIFMMIIVIIAVVFVLSMTSLTAHFNSSHLLPSNDGDCELKQCWRTRSIRAWEDYSNRCTARRDNLLLCRQSNRSSQTKMTVVDVSSSIIRISVTTTTVRVIRIVISFKVTNKSWVTICKMYLYTPIN